ncbi:Voltage-gated hydrogen channel 1 [Escovopsis weberi]|uniref:Voltage-gated hydrogen channel 1 n=1 Tax=Escovopsis weberi TaxID=150374 RepID=A0A0M8MVR3_ESCWE|nr:Voltage-gated hydrogen channel 1 [Escovopsis weberi]
MSSQDALAPLLRPQSGDGDGDGDGDEPRASPQRRVPPAHYLSHRSCSCSYSYDALPPRLLYRSRRLRRDCRHALASRPKHFAVMAAVALDVFAVMASIFIQLIACRLHQDSEPWVLGVVRGLGFASLGFAGLFLLELVACLVAFGFSHLASWFQFFDSMVILASFAIDAFATGLTRSIGSLVVVLRLWRLAKMSEEVVLGASERIEILEDQLEDLKDENHRLRSQVSSCAASCHQTGS